MNRAVSSALIISCLLICSRSGIAQTYPIRRSVPVVKGDRWRADITSVKQSVGKISVDGKTKRVSEKETTRLIAAVAIGCVDADGYAMTWQAEVIRFSGPFDGGSSKDLLPRGAVVLFDRSEGQLIVVHENGQPLQNGEARITEFLTLPVRIDDAPFEPENPVAPGKSWMADVASMRSAAIEKGPPQLKLYPEVMGLRASGRLLSLAKRRGQDCLEISLKTAVRITEAIESETQIIQKAEQDVEETFLMPADYSTDFIEKRTTNTDVLFTKGKSAAPGLDVTQTTTTTELRTYSRFNGGGVRPWKSLARPDALLQQLLFGLTFDKASVTGTGDAARIQPIGRISAPALLRATADLPGKVGEAGAFNGSNNHVNVLDAPDMLRSDVKAITIACWIKSPPTPLAMLFDLGFYGSKSITLLRQQEVATFHLGPETGGVGLQFPLKAADWTHVAVTWDGSAQRAFVNGQIVAEVATTRKGTLNETSIAQLACMVGAQSKRSGRGKRCFNGQMDEFALWTRALDASEVARVFQKGAKGESLFSN